MFAVASSDTGVETDDMVKPAHPVQDKNQLPSGHSGPEAPSRQTPVRSTTILHEVTRSQDSRYPTDRPGEAAGDHGRAWKIYRDRVKDIDEDLLEGWNDTLNMLLVFAGLFSAACTAFLIEVTKNLQPDWQRATSLAVFAIYIHLNSTGPPPFEVPNPLSFVAATDARWINGLWFTSLTLSLIVSLLAILAKQWLNEFKSRIRAPNSSPKMWAIRHSAFKGGLERWGMDAFISTLPLLLHAALFFFLTGLCLLLLPLDDRIAGIIIAMTAVIGVFYVLAGLAPLFWGHCPSATPMLRYLHSLWTQIMKPMLLGPSRVVMIAYSILIGGILVLTTLIAGLLDLVFCARLCRSNGIFQAFNEAFIIRAGVLIVPDSVRFFRFDIASSPTVTVLRYRPKATPTPAFDQAKILGSDEPLYEAAILSWMIRTLPSEDDIHAALCAVGWLAATTHFDYFRGRSPSNPLVHEDLRRAAVDTLDNIAACADTPDDLMVASIIRACLFVAEGPLVLVARTMDFLSRYTDHHAYDLNLLALATLDGVKAAPRNALSQWTDMKVGPADLISLSATRGRPALRGITRMLLSAPGSPLLPSSEAHIFALESDILRDERCRKTGWQPRVEDDLRLRFLAVMDIGLWHSDAFMMYDWERRAIPSLYAAAVGNIAYDAAMVLPRDLERHMGWTKAPAFCNYNFSVEDLNAIGTLCLRVLPEGRSCVHPLALFNLLNHFERRSLPITPEALHWIKSAFKLPSAPNRLVDGLRQYPSATEALFKSHLSLLRPVGSSSRARSSWSRLRTLVPIAKATKHLAYTTYAYTVLLLALHRRGYHTTAQTLLRELLPCAWAADLISRQSHWRHHIALHAKVISVMWWEQIRQRLLLPGSAMPWEPCTKYPDAEVFSAAVAAQSDCLHCAQDKIPIRWGTSPTLPDAGKADSVLDLSNPMVWKPSRPVVSGGEAPWYAPLTFNTRLSLRLATPTGTSGAVDAPQQLDPDLESGPSRAGE